MRIFYLLFLALFLPFQAVAGPFGTNMGDSIIKYYQPKKIGNNTWLVKEMPKNHSEFREYVLDMDKNGGLGRIRAISKPIQKNQLSSLIKLFNELADGLNSKYGQSYASSETSKKSIRFPEPGSWLVWKTNLPDNLDSIYLLSSHEDEESDIVVLTYTYKNFAEEEKDKKKLIENEDQLRRDNNQKAL